MLATHAAPQCKSRDQLPHQPPFKFPLNMFSCYSPSPFPYIHLYSALSRFRSHFPPNLARIHSHLEFAYENSAKTLGKFTQLRLWNYANEFGGDLQNCSLFIVWNVNMFLLIWARNLLSLKCSVSQIAHRQRRKKKRWNENFKLSSFGCLWASPFK